MGTDRICVCIQRRRAARRAGASMDPGVGAGCRVAVQGGMGWECDGRPVLYCTVFPSRLSLLTCCVYYK